MLMDVSKGTGPLSLMGKRFVAWKAVKQPNGRETKVPLSPHGGNASTTDRRTWGTFDEALRVNGNVGVVLGRMNWADPRMNWYLCGMDLDGCVVNGVLTDEAAEVVERFGTYTELSPSGKGVHLLFAVMERDVEKFRAMYSDKARHSFGVGEHREMALDLDARYYAVTGDEYGMKRDLATVKLGTLEWLMHDAGPAYQRRYGNGKDKARDESGSGYGFRFFREMRKEGLSYVVARAKIMKDPGRSGQWARRSDERQLKRAWEQAGAPYESVGGDDDGAYLDVHCMSEVEMKPYDWCWRNYLVFGYIAMIAGEANVGKSTIVLDLVARITKEGSKWPDGTIAPSGSALLMSAEDNAGDTTKPRLIACGADCRRVYFATMVKTRKNSRMFSLVDSLKVLEASLRPDTRVVVIDPVTAFMGVKKIDSWRATDVRGVLAPLCELAERRNILIILITHFRKMAGTALNRIMDSQAFPATARPVIIVAKDGDQRYFLPSKNNFVRDGNDPGWSYAIKGKRIAEGVYGSYVIWGEEVDIKADDLAQPGTGKALKVNDARHAAKEFLQDELRDGRHVNGSELHKRAERRNIAHATLHRAANDLGVIKRKHGSWHLPG